MSNKTILILIFVTQNIFTEPTISFYIKPYPTISVQKIKNNLNKRLAIPGYLGYKMLKIGIPSSIEGIPCIYAGEITFSDSEGLVRFVRAKQKTDLELIITDKIKPVFSVPWVIENWVDEIDSVAWYSIHGFTDQPTKQQLWETKAVEAKQKIPNYAIIIFSPKDEIYLPEGVSYATFDQQIVLPTVYAKSKKYSPMQALEVLKIKQFFATVKSIFNPNDELLNQIQTN